MNIFFFTCILLSTLILSTNSLYFEIKGDSERCFVDEFYKNTVVVIKYNIIGIDLTEEAKESNDLVSRHIIRTFSGKFSFTVNADANYKICAQNVVASWLGDKKVFMSMKIGTDSHDEMNLTNMVKKEDLHPVSHKINKIIKKANKIIKRQSMEIEGEDFSYTLQNNYSKILVTFTVAQILIVILIGVYHLYSFRKYLMLNKII